MTHCTTACTKTSVWQKSFGKINPVILVDHCTALNCLNAASTAALSNRRYAVCTFINPGSPRKPRGPKPSVSERALLNLLKFCQLRFVTPERPITSTVRLLTHVRCKPTHFFFNSLIPTMSNSIQTSLDNNMKDWADKYHVWGTPTSSPSRSISRYLKHAVFYIKIEYLSHIYVA